MTDVTVNLVIPIPCEPSIGAPSLTFASWLPIGEAQGIIREQGNIVLKLWFDLTSTWQHLKEEELAFHLNVLADRVFADAVLRDTPDELATYMSRRDFTRKPTPEEEPLQQQYDELAYRLFAFVVETLNRFLAYVRSKKGQYWLSEYPIDKGRMASYYVHFQAKANFGDGLLFRFGPSSIDSRTVEWVSNERYIHRDDWDDIRSFVCGTSRPPLVGALLAGAEALAASGQSRSALTEAVAALEVALDNFAIHPNADRAFGAKLRRRLNIASLKHQVRRMGLTGSFSYLLPTILPEAVLSDNILKECQEAIKQRQLVGHQGQREVAAERLKASLTAIRQMCAILDSLTTATEDASASREIESPA